MNGAPFELVGGGVGKPYDGKLASRLTSKNGPLPFSMHLMDIVAIFGYPTYSCYHEDTTDLFKRSRGGYEYERHLKFENGGFMDTLHKITNDGTSLEGDFCVVDGQVEAPELIGIEPIVETFIPAGPGKIRSECVVAWRKKEGGIFSAKCSSEYRLRHDLELPYLHFRVVHFTTNHTQEILDQQETLNVFRHIGQTQVSSVAFKPTAFPVSCATEARIEA